MISNSNLFVGCLIYFNYLKFSYFPQRLFVLLLYILSQQTLSIDFQFQVSADAYAITSKANLENSFVGKGIEILYFLKAENTLKTRRIHLFIVRMLPPFTQQEYILKIFTVLMCYDENKSCEKNYTTRQGHFLHSS